MVASHYGAWSFDLSKMWTSHTEFLACKAFIVNLQAIVWHFPIFVPSIHELSQEHLLPFRSSFSSFPSTAWAIPIEIYRAWPGNEAAKKTNEIFRSFPPLSTLDKKSSFVIERRRKKGPFVLFALALSFIPYPNGHRNRSQRKYHPLALRVGYHLITSLRAVFA